MTLTLFISFGGTKTLYAKNVKSFGFAAYVRNLQATLADGSQVTFNNVSYVDTFVK